MRKSSIFVPSVDSDFDFTSNHPGPAFFAASLKLASLLGSNPWPFLLSWFASGIRRSAAMSTLNHIQIYISLHFHKAKCFSMSMSFMRPDLLDSPQIFSFIWIFSWRCLTVLSTHTGSLQTYHLHCSFQTLSSNEKTRRWGETTSYILPHNPNHIKDLTGNNKKHWFGKTANSLMFPTSNDFKPSTHGGTQRWLNNSSAGSTVPAKQSNLLPPKHFPSQATQMEMKSVDLMHQCFAQKA